MGVLQDETAGKRPGAPNVKIWVSNVANSGDLALGLTSTFKSVSRALALRLAKIPSLRGVGLAGAGGGIGVDGGVAFDTVSSDLGFWGGGGDDGFFFVNCS